MDSVQPIPLLPIKPKHIYYFHIDIVHGCQLRCVGCPNSTLLPKISRISVEDFRACLGNVDVERVHTLRLFNFGEPLLHKHLAEIVAVIPQQSFKTSIVEISTNAQRVDWQDFENTLKQEVVNRLVVSCDGDGTPSEYERLRPPSKWSHLIEFLERARVLRDRWSGSTTDHQDHRAIARRCRSVEIYFGTARMDTGVSRLDGFSGIGAKHDRTRNRSSIRRLRFSWRARRIFHASLAR